jgi:RNA polymerase sigma-70 factor (ECF subfamily)
MDSLETRSDGELLRLSLAGQESAFLILYERLKRPIFRYVFYMTNSKTAAEEITQELFICLLREGGRYREEQGDIAAFAFGIARNLIRRLKRRERPYEALPDDETLEKLALSAISKPEPVSGQLIRQQLVDRVRMAIAALPDHYRQVIVLCDLCEFSYAEAASRLNCRVGTIRSRLNRGHALLARRLKQAGKPRTELPAAGTEECLI